MHKKLITACMALAAFLALAAPPSTALAVNDPDLTEGGSLVGTNAELKGTNVGTLVMTNSGTSSLVTCTTTTLTGTVTANTGSTVAGNVETTTIGGTGTTATGAPHTECTATFGNATVTLNPATNGIPWCLHSSGAMADNEFQIRGGKCSEEQRPIRYVLHSTGAGECTYQRGTAILGFFTTGGEAAQMSISEVEFPKVAGGFLCPGAGFIDMTFNVETANGTGLTFS